MLFYQNKNIKPQSQKKQNWNGIENFFLRISKNQYKQINNIIGIKKYNFKTKILYFLIV